MEKRWSSVTGLRRTACLSPRRVCEMNRLSEPSESVASHPVTLRQRDNSLHGSAMEVECRPRLQSCWQMKGCSRQVLDAKCVSMSKIHLQRVRVGKSHSFPPVYLLCFPRVHFASDTSGH